MYNSDMQYSIPSFENNLKKSIADQPYSILIDESTDISVLKFLGITIMYFDRKIGKIMSTYLSLIEMDAMQMQLQRLSVKLLKKKASTSRKW